MFRRILFVILIFGAAGGAYLWLRRTARGGSARRIAGPGRRGVRLPSIPESWARVASQDRHLAEGLQIRTSLAELVERGSGEVQADLVREVDELLICVVDLVELRLETEQRVRIVEASANGEAAPDLERLGQLRERPEQLEVEVQSAVSELRETYLHVVDSVAAPTSGARDLIARTRDRAAQLRRRVKAERELRSILDGLPDPGPSDG